MRFGHAFRLVKPIATPFETLDIQEADVRAEFLSVSEQEVVLALVAAAEQHVGWVGLERSQLVAFAKRERWQRVRRAPSTIVDVFSEDIDQRVHDAVMALVARNCVKIYHDTVCPTPTLVDRLARACAREP